jgi:hypothetical protein
MQQTLNKGRLRGRREGDPLGAAAVSRRGMMRIVQEIVLDRVTNDKVRQAAMGGSRRTYGGLKQSPVLSIRASIKSRVTGAGNGLQGWRVAADDDVDWSLEDADRDMFP